jgi:signal transduction histidine kinase
VVAAGGRPDLPTTEDADSSAAPSIATDEVRRLLLEEQALRGVAALIATAGPSDDVLTAVCRAASEQLNGQDITLLRFETPDTIVAVASYGGPVPPGTRVVHRPGSLSEQVARTGRPVRVDDFERVTSADIVRRYDIRAGVGVPIFIAGRVWGMFSATSETGPLPLDTESRLEAFAQLTWAAIANTDARDDLRRLAEEQAALRHVAELVARESPLPAVLRSVVEEAARVLDASSAAVVHHRESPDEVVAETGIRPDSVAHRVDCPVVVHAQRWGTLELLFGAPGRRPDEERVKPFADLIAAAIANAEHRQGLTQSRARVIAAADEARRRLQRDVHDGAQQRLVHTIITLKLARAAAARGDGVGDLLAEALTNAEDANQQLRDVVRGILPPALAHSGLAAGVESLVADSSTPVVIEIDVPRLPTAVETTAYFAVAEAVTNAVKHARATRIHVTGAVSRDGGELAVTIRDDGIGGADASRGSGLTGLADRVESSGGSITVTSPPNHGTVVTVRMPVGVADAG